MRSIPLIGAAAALLVASMPALADRHREVLELGLRLGYSLPLGRVHGAETMTNGVTTATSPAESLSDAARSQIPIWADIGLRATPRLYVGGFFQYGIAFVPNNSTTGCRVGGVSCSGHDLMFGVDAHYHIMPGTTLDPWVGLGVGYESFGTSQSANGQSASGSFSGFQFVNVQAGGDCMLTPNLGVGPFVAFSLGEFTSASYDQGATSTSSSVEYTGLHEWLTIGVRGAYDIVF
jgi:hypothetical protein